MAQQNPLPLRQEKHVTRHAICHESSRMSFGESCFSSKQPPLFPVVTLVTNSKPFSVSSLFCSSALIFPTTPRL
jgi:hypothetical protein